MWLETVALVKFMRLIMRPEAAALGYEIDYVSGGCSAGL